MNSIKKYALYALLVVPFVVPLFASADSLGEIRADIVVLQAQLQKLLERVDNLQSQSDNDPSVSIKNVTGPTTLKTGEVGTWTIKANVPGQITAEYSVVWGDESLVEARSITTSTSDSATFTHTYTTAGTYNPKFTVTNTSKTTNTDSVSKQVVVTQVSVPVPKTLTVLSPSSDVTWVAGTAVKITWDSSRSVPANAKIGIKLVSVTNSSYIIRENVPNDGKTSELILPSNVAAGKYYVQIFLENETSVADLSEAVVTVTKNAIISSISPQSGQVGTKVTITGKAFGIQDTVFFGTTEIPATSGDGANISFVVPQVEPGSYSITVKSDISAEKTNAKSFTVTPAPIVDNSNPGGFLDSASCSVVSGWTCDADSNATSLKVQIFRGTKLLGTATANESRTDLYTDTVNVCGGTTAHGFTFQMPNLAAGTYSISAKAVDVDSAGKEKSSKLSELLQSPQKIQCGANITFSSPAQGAVWIAGTKQTISWKSPGITVSSVKLRIRGKNSDNLTANYNIGSVPNNGSKQITVPSLPAGTYSVEISAVVNGTNVSKDSPEFTIKSAAESRAAGNSAVAGIVESFSALFRRMQEK